MDIDFKQLTAYWIKTAEHDHETMMFLYKGKKYSAALFYGHIVLEKILKALVVKKTGKQAPYIHDLLRLANLAKLDLSENQKNILDMANDYNIRARYPEVKFNFYKSCTKTYTSPIINNINKLYTELCQKLKQKK